MTTTQRVRACRRDQQPVDLSLLIDGKCIGKGTFATVYKVHSETTGETLAMKEVLLDPKHKNRELEIMLELTHPNVVQLKFYFNRELFNDRRIKSDYSCLLMELLPETFQSLIKRFHTSSLPFAEHREELKLYTFQMFRALAYLHHHGIAHRDIKPSNLLVDPAEKILKLCDFGSAKRLLPNDVSVSYICSRYYRAPELIVGCTTYTPSIDIWAGACVMVEFYSGVPLFKGKTNFSFKFSIDELRIFRNEPSRPIRSRHVVPGRTDARRNPRNELEIVFGDRPAAASSRAHIQRGETKFERLFAMAEPCRSLLDFVMFTPVSIFSSSTINRAGNLDGRILRRSSSIESFYIRSNGKKSLSVDRKGK